MAGIWLLCDWPRTLAQISDGHEGEPTEPSFVPCHFLLDVEVGAPVLGNENCYGIYYWSIMSAVRYTRLHTVLTVRTEDTDCKEKV